ncbi:MAG: DUF3592 domain-containing protein [Anaerolineales bacterium]|nr:DUF3592 domain-containing protein [Anaerolineales bacterium]
MTNLGLIICGALPVLAIAVCMILYNLFVVLRWEKTTGTVIGYKSSRSSKGGVIHAEVVEFQGPNGQTIQFTEKAYLSRFIFREGQTVKVLYNPDKPTSARVNKFTTLYLAPMILTIVGIGLTLFSLPMFNGVMQKLLDFLLNIVNKLPWWL